MNRLQIRWGWALAGAVLAEATMVAAAFAWVAFYSMALHPGEAASFYQAYALRAAPWVSVIAGVPIFYGICHWLAARAPPRGWPSALAVFGFYALIETAFLLVQGSGGLSVCFMAGNLLAKLLASWLGGLSGAARLAG